MGVVFQRASCALSAKAMTYAMEHASVSLHWDTGTADGQGKGQNGRSVCFCDALVFRKRTCEYNHLWFFQRITGHTYFFSNLVLHSYYILVFRKRVHFESLPWAQVFPSTWRLMPVGQAQLEPLGGGARRHRWLQPPLFTAHGVRTTQKMTDGYGQMERD